MRAPDGYTISQIPLIAFRAPFQGKTSYDPAKDFTFIVGVSGYAYGVVVRSDAPWMSFRDLLADATNNPGKINYGTAGVGTTQHITMALIARQRGAQWAHVPFRGDPDLINALLGGHIQVVAGTTAWGSHVDAGQFRLLSVWGTDRITKWPTIPTLKEIGIDMVVNSPYGLAGPKGLDPRIVKTLHDAFKKGMGEPSFIAMLEKLDQEPNYLNSEDYHKYAMNQITEQQRIVEELGLRGQ